MECICIDQEYDIPTMEAFIKNSIRYPKKNEICTITRVHKYILRGKTGVFVQGYESQYLIDRISGATNEVSFSIFRFTHLDGQKIANEELKKLKELV